MDKIVFRLLALVGFFFASLWAVNQVNWMEMFGVEENISSTEQKVGELFWEFFANNNTEVMQDKILLPVDSLLSKICTANGIKREEISLHIIKKDEVNAFALPNKHLVIFTGLLANVKNEAELSGVIGHELAHIQLDHVMKKLVKEIGLAVVITMTSGNGNSQVLMESIKTLTSSAYDRSLEEDADRQSVDYLMEADINPMPFADFLYTMGGENAEMEEYMSWISTHPYSKERAEEIIHYCQEKTYQKEPVLDNKSWKQLKKAVEEL
ncbi:MAG: M48 family metallopeptidase [Cyclobacteriaceae bacterium]|nr:M48 family metallopeptidase [Cyclobacteriaceae bacterium]